MRLGADGPTQRPGSPTLIGRGDALDRLVAAIRSSPGVVVIEGESGVGKSRLLVDALAHPDLSDRRLLVGSCRRIREPFPLGPIVEALRETGDLLGRVELSPVAGALRGLLPELAPVLPPRLERLGEPAGERHQVFRGLGEVLGALGAAVLVVEDLHWADQQTEEFLMYLLPALPTDMSVVLTYRTEEAGSPVKNLTRATTASVPVQHIVLPALDAHQTGSLAAAILGIEHVSAEFGAHLCALSSGLPLAILELVALLRSRGDLIRLGNGRWARKALDELDVPAGIRDPVRERIGRLPLPVQRVAEAVAVLQEPSNLTVVQAVSASTRQETVMGVDELLVSGLLDERDGRVAFRHVLASQAVYGGIPLGRRQQLHARAAGAVRALKPAPLGLLAHHLHQGSMLEEWVEVAEEAARQAAGLGDDVEAVRILEEVLRTASISAPTRGRLSAQLGWAAGQVLDPPPVLDLLSMALDEQGPGPLRGELHFLTGLMLERLGDDPGAQRRALAAAVHDLGGRPHLSAWAMSALGRPTGPAVTMAEHLHWLDRAIDTVPSIEDPVDTVFVLGKVATSLCGIGDPRWAHQTRGITDRTSGVPAHRQEINAYRSIAENAGCAGHFTIARSLLDAAKRSAAESESDRESLARCRLVGLLLDYEQARWAGLTADVGSLMEEYSDRPGDRITAETVDACLLLACGDTDAARQYLPVVVDGALALGGYELLPLSLTALARLVIHDGDGDAALRVAADAWTIWGTKGLWPLGVRALPAIVGALRVVGRSVEGLDLLGRAGGALQSRDAPFAAPALDHARGLLAESAGESATYLLAAATGYDQLGARYEAAQASEAAAERLFVLGDDRATGLLQRALASYGDMGAEWDLGRASQRARQHGVPVRGRYHRGAQGYRGELSPREREVAGLAASGLTNKEIGAELFLSPKTVEKHLGSVLRKLGLRSRAALGAHHELGAGARPR